MSGIAGLIRFDGGSVDPALIRSMGDALAHRGPDGRGEWVKGSVGLTQVALYTTPESFEERQPLAHVDESLVLVMDGWLSNWEELRQELLGRGARLRDRSDAELVLRAYEEWGGEHCLDHIDGDFALVIWDGRERRAFCARDRVGNKPFHYRWDGATFAFASELHAILGLPGVEARLNEGMVAEFVAAEWHTRDQTFWTGISRLVSAHVMTIGPAGPRVARYWTPDLKATLPCRSDEDYVDRYRNLLDDAVRRCSRTHGTLACEVSGGLDSSAVFAVAEHLRRAGALLTSTLEGYTLAFEGDPEFDDLDYARAVGQFLGRSVHEVIPFEPGLEWYRDWASRYRDFPGYPNGFMSWRLREKARHGGSRVVLTGVGGDELLTGGPFALAEEIAARRWSGVRALWAADRGEFGLRQSVARLIRLGFLPLVPERYRKWDRFVRRRLASRPLGPEDWLTPPLLAALRNRRRAARRPPGAWTRIGQRQLHQALTDAFSAFARELEDRMASRVGVELRHPLLAAPIIQFAFAAPERLRRRGRRTRVFHRLALSSRLPPLITDRGSKAFFSGPFLRALEAARASTPSLAAAPAWVCDSGLDALTEALRGRSTAATPAWVLWNLMLCKALGATAAPAE